MAKSCFTTKDERRRRRRYYAKRICFERRKKHCRQDGEAGWRGRERKVYVVVKRKMGEKGRNNEYQQRRGNARESREKSSVYVEVRVGVIWCYAAVSGVDEREVRRRRRKSVRCSFVDA